MKRATEWILATLMILIGVFPLAAQDDEARPVITAANMEELQPIYYFRRDTGYHDLVWSPDGSQLALGAEDGVWLVDVTASNPEPVRLPGTEDYIYSLAYHPEKPLLAVGYDLNRVELFDTTTGELIAELPEHVWTVLDVAFSPDGSLLATGGLDGDLHVVDVESGELIYTLRDETEELNPWFGVAFHPTENIIIGGGDWMQHWDTTTGDPLGWYIEEPPFVDYPAAVGVTCFDFNGEKTLLATGGPGYFTLWNLETETQIDSFGDYELPVEAVSFSPDGRLLVVAGMGGALEVWNIGNLTSVWQGPPSDEIVYGAAFSPDQTLLAYATTGGEAVIMGVIED
jgi:WD40 repeat protein